jgi:hypothetical protein
MIIGSGQELTKITLFIQYCPNYGAVWLLYVPSHPAREFDTDLERAGIRKWPPEGKLDFHALRTTFCTFVIESGTNLGEAMSLMRHSTPDLTVNTYARTRMDQIQELAEKVGTVLKSDTKRAPGMLEAVAGTKTTTDNTNNANMISGEKNWWRQRAEGPSPINPAQRRSRRSLALDCTTELTINVAKENSNPRTPQHPRL